MKKNNITVVGAGYVGFSQALILSNNNKVSILETDDDKIANINNSIPPISDKSINEYLSNNDLNIFATKSKDVYRNANYIVIATPTNFNNMTNSFDTSIVENEVKSALAKNKNALIIIKSTIPIGFTSELKKKYKTENIVFSPEFLREGHALEDSYFPSRIIVGGKCTKSKNYAALLKAASKKEDTNILFMSSEEAESVKLFSNAYLALRVSFFNELDSFALTKKLSAENIINGLSLDARIGSFYNNPSFGYGGYCLPKDTKQLLSSFGDVPESIVSSIIKSNEIRKVFIAKNVLKQKPKVVGIYRLIMKSDSDNSRSSAIKDIVNTIIQNNVKVILFEPLLTSHDLDVNVEIFEDLDLFKKVSDVILCNRFDDSLQDVESKIFTRDIFRNN